MEKRFEDYKPEERRPPANNCSTCEHYYMGTCDGLRGWCNNYKQYRAKTLEELVKISIGTTTLFGVLLAILAFVNIFVR